MLRVRRKSNQGRRAKIEFQGRVLSGVVEAGFLMAAADGELSPEELDTLAGVIVGFTDGTCQHHEVTALLEACDHALAADGYDARINAVVQNLPTHELRRIGLLCSAVVLGADDAFSEQHEGELYLSMATALGLTRDEALDLLDEARQLYEAPPAD